MTPKPDNSNSLLLIGIDTRCFAQKSTYFQPKQARKLQSYASPKLRPSDPVTRLLTGVKCRATSVAKNGLTRWAVDYRPLNKITIKYSYPLPSISENLEKMQGSRVFSTLDAAGAYHCVPVAPKTRLSLAFVTQFGLYTLKRMPIGASNAGE